MLLEPTALLDPMVLLFQAGDAWDRGGSSRQDVWGPAITWLQAIVLSAGGLGLTLGVIHKLMGDDDSDRETAWNRIMGASIMGLLLGLLAEPFVNVLRRVFGL